jgi:lambda family phage tail tape measure protein
MSPEQINNFVDAVVKIGTAAASIYAVTQAASGLGRTLAWLSGSALSLYAMFKVGTAQATAGWASLTRTLQVTLGYIKSWSKGTPMFDKANGAVKNFMTLLQKLGQRVGFLRIGLALLGAGIARIVIPIAAAVASFMALNEIVKLFTGGKHSLVLWFEQAAAAVGKFVSEKVPGALEAFMKMREAAAGLFGDAKKPELPAPGKTPLPEGVKPSPYEGGRGNAQAELDARLEHLKKEQEERQRNIDKTKEALAEEKRLAEEMAKRRKEIENTVIEFKNQNDATLAQIGLEQELIGKTEDYKEMRRAVADVEAKAKNEIDKLIEAKNNLTDKEKGLIPVYDEQIAKIQAQAVIDKDRIAKATQGLQTVRMLEEARTREIENQTAAIEAQIQRQQQLGDAIRSANDKMRETEFAGQQQKRSPLEQQIAQIQENARQAALEAGRAFAAGFEGMDLTADQAQELANGLDQIAQRYKAIAEEQTKQLEYSRSWEAGWKNAFDSYMDNATNASKTAGEVFNSITKNMESAIDNFVETGKFSFKDFARSIIQDLIKIELKAQATKILGALGGSGGIFSAIGSLFGFANGGTPPLNKPSIVGENGPELFIPKALGTVVPGKDLKMSGGGGGIVNNNTYVTNNISAVDAKSVAQLFAENRKTLLGTVEMARKEMPYGR